MRSSGSAPAAIIVGAGPVGLALAVELGLRRVPCLVVECRDRVGLSPRAKTTNVCTREHLRRFGVAEALRDASPIPRDYPFDVVFATRMTGHGLARFENVSNGRLERSELFSEAGQWVPQYTPEEVLRAQAAALPGVELRFQAALTAFQQDPDGVTAEVGDVTTGAAATHRCAYLVGADGARSTVREAIGARMTGDAPAVLGPMDEHGLWFFMATKLPGGVEPDEAAAIDMIRRSTGLADLAITVERGDPWVARCRSPTRTGRGACSWPATRAIVTRRSAASA